MIRSEPENIEQIRELNRKMSDAELRKYGRAARDLSDPKKNFGPPNPAFKIQLDEARAESAELCEQVKLRRTSQQSSAGEIGEVLLGDGCRNGMIWY
jgi:hypothetical protein